jgi:hypothetical protein
MKARSKGSESPGESESELTRRVFRESSAGPSKRVILCERFALWKFCFAACVEVGEFLKKGVNVTCLDMCLLYLASDDLSIFRNGFGEPDSRVPKR